MSRSRLTLGLVAGSLLSGLAAAQSCIYYPGDTPSLGAPDDRPLGVTSPAGGWLRYQVQVPSAVLGNQPLDIAEVFVAPAGTRTHTYVSLGVIMGHNPGPLTNNLNANVPWFGREEYVTRLASVTIPMAADHWHPIGMRSSYRYDPAIGELVVEFLIRAGDVHAGAGSTGMRTDPSIPFVWTSGLGSTGTVVAGGGIKLCFCTENHGFYEYPGGSCVGSNNQTPALGYSGTPRIGNTVNVHVTGGPTGGPTLTVLVWGLAPRLVPFDLAGLGASGCVGYPETDVVSWMVTSGGSHANTLAIPATMPAHLRLWNQWFFFDAAANPLGITASNWGGVVIGN